MASFLHSTHSPASVRVAAASEALPGTETSFLELRRKVQESELLSSATQRLLISLRFNGRLTVVIHDGHVLKSGYEEGYFRSKST